MQARTYFQSAPTSCQPCQPSENTAHWRKGRAVEYSRVLKRATKCDRSPGQAALPRVRSPSDVVNLTDGGKLELELR